MQKQTKLFILIHQSINKYIHFQLHHHRSQESLILQKYHFLLYKFKPLSIASQKLKIITCFCYILRVQYLIIKQHKNILKGTKKWAKTFLMKKNEWSPVLIISERRNTKNQTLYTRSSINQQIYFIFNCITKGNQ